MTEDLSAQQNRFLPEGILIKHLVAGLRSRCPGKYDAPYREFGYPVYEAADLSEHDLAEAVRETQGLCPGWELLPLEGASIRARMAAHFEEALERKSRPMTLRERDIALATIDRVRELDHELGGLPRYLTDDDA